MNKGKIEILCGTFCIIFVIGGIYLTGTYPECLSAWIEKTSSIPSHKVPPVSKIWKHGGGVYVVNYLDFRDSDFMHIRNDTLFHVGKPVGVIIETKKLVPKQRYTMTLQRIPDGEISYYKPRH